ncbi:MAG: diguanylate cyclase [Candidatus Marinimicrobia bacterium]|nr:diguanylate cyclase [Candidatus Neomarinimicrobiota bacterium]
MQDNTPTILIVDDTKTNIDILLELLSDDYELMVALDGKSAIEIAGQEDIDLILLDIMMPGMDGFETCMILQENKSTKDIPVIFLTAKTDEESIAKAYDVGGLDYVTKPFKVKELLARVKTQLKLNFLIEHLEYISSYDAMTGIYNRRKFFELSEEKFKTQKDTLFAVMIDIDKFKAINDAYGHPLGDKVIKLVTKTIGEFFGEEAVLGRLGGEEFAIVYNSHSFETVIQEVESMRNAVEMLDIIADNGDLVKCTISGGIAEVGDNMITLDQLLKEADIALYEAKGSGRNRSIFRS